MIVVILLMRPLLALLLSLDCLIWQWLDIIVIGLVPRVHHCQLLPIDLEIRVIGFPKGGSSVLRGKELNKGKILESSSQFVLDLPDIPDRHKRFEDLQQSAFFHFRYHRSPDHQTAVLSGLLPNRPSRWLCAVAEPTGSRLLRFAAIALIPPGEVFIIALIAIPIIGYVEVDLPNRKVLYLEFFITNAGLSFQMLHH